MSGNGTGNGAGDPSAARGDRGSVPAPAGSSSPTRRRRRSGSSDRSVRLDAPSRSELRDQRRALGSGRRPRRATTPVERWVIWAIAALAAVAGALADAHPTGTAGVDPLLAGAAAGVVTLAASRAQRWTWLLLAGVATAMAAEPAWQVVAGAGLLVAFASTFLPRARWIGALSAGLAVQGLLRSDIGVFHGASVLLGAAAVAPVLVSGWEVAPRSSRRVALRVAAGVGAAVVVASTLAAMAVLLARADLEDAVAESQEGLDALADGRPVEAEASLSAAASAFSSGGATAGAWWSLPGRLVPVVAQQRAAVVELAAAGEAITSQAAAAAGKADVQQLRYEDGRIDLDLVRATQEPLAATVTALEEAESRVEAAQSPWLLGAVAERVQQFEDDVVSTLPSARLAADAVVEIPPMLGADGTRRYLVLFTTPAESRGLGGFVGNWGVLEATDGRVELVDSGRISELNETPVRDDRTVTEPADYVTRYGRFRPAYWLQDTTLSPDLPSVATAWRQLWPQLRGEELDGVVVVDPFGLAALLELTGPIRVDGWPEPLTSDNVAEVLLERQYAEITDRDERADLLDEASRVAFEALTTGTLPSPREASQVLAPAVASGRLALWTFDESEQALLRRVGVDGSFPRVGGGDLLGVVTQNSAQNKIDVFLEREVDYDLTYDPATGAVAGTATITLTNTAPSEGLSPAVIGNNDQGLPSGTNRVWMSVYSPLGLDEARLDGRRIGVEFNRELPRGDDPGWAVYGGFFTIPPGATITIELDLAGTVEPGAYRLSIPRQPVVNPDDVHVSVAVPPGWAFPGSERVGVSADGRTATLDLATFDADAELVLRPERG